MNLSTNAPTKNKPFLFDLSFDEGLNEDTPHILTTREIREKEEAAYQKGQTAGMQEVQNSLMTAIKILLETIQTEIYALKEDNTAYHAAVAQEATKILQDLVSKFTPELLQHHIIRDAHQQIISWISRHETTKSLKLIMGPNTQARMQQYVDEHQPNLNESLAIIADPNMNESNYALKWNLGELHYSRDQLVADISEILSNAQNSLSKKVIDTAIDISAPLAEAPKSSEQTSDSTPAPEAPHPETQNT